MSERGRPRKFDRTEALEKAMEVFWARGYVGASLAELTAAMGINPPSLYAAFGSKDALFREAVELFLDREDTCTPAWVAGELTTRQSITAMLMAAAR
ncbi:TetR/AcrR family transcriptional regulator, partial [Mycobacterium tuberculosis]|nr:TetR/AcrR family transcriptional regulator [Mycobacterium tuberculosis]